MRALRGLSLFGGLAVVLTLFFAMGCSNNAPVQPDNFDSLAIGNLSGKIIPNQPSPSIETYDSEYIDSDSGGEIVIKRGDYVHNFVVGAGALPQDTLITVRTVNEEVIGMQMIVFEFGPDGLEFKKSALVQFDMAELSAEVAKANLYYYDPKKGDWVFQISVDVKGGIAEFPIDHFSKYAISD